MIFDVYVERLPIDIGDVVEESIIGSDIDMILLWIYIESIGSFVQDMRVFIGLKEILGFAIFDREWLFEESVSYLQPENVGWLSESGIVLD